MAISFATTDLPRPARALTGTLAAILLALLLSPPAPAAGPKLLILMQEKVMGVFGTTGWEVPTQAELTLMEHFAGQGYEVVDLTTMRRNLEQQRGLKMLAGDDHGAAVTGLQHGARWSILGTAISKPAGAKLFGTQMQSIQATLTARVVDNDTARVIATATATTAKPHIDEVQGGVLAIQEAARKLAADLSGQIQHTAAPAAGGTVMINVSGLVSFRHLQFLMDYLQSEVPGVADLTLDNFNSGLAEIRVTHPGGGDAIAGAVSAKRFTGFRLEPGYVSESRVDMAVVLDQ